jgi:hypothetical protein
VPHGAVTYLDDVIRKLDHPGAVYAVAVVALSFADLVQRRDGTVGGDSSHVFVGDRGVHFRQSRDLVEVGGEQRETFHLFGQVPATANHVVLAEPSRLTYSAIANAIPHPS